MDASESMGFNSDDCDGGDVLVPGTHNRLVRLPGLHFCTLDFLLVALSLLMLLPTATRAGGTEPCMDSG